MTQYQKSNIRNRNSKVLCKRTEDTWINRILYFCKKRHKLAQRVAGIVLWDYIDVLGSEHEKLSNLAWDNPHLPVPDVPDQEIEKILVKIGYHPVAAKVRSITPRDEKFYEQRRKQWTMG